MSDDSFFREVNEDLRSERLKSFWDRYGALIIAVVVIIIAATAGWRGYEYWQERQASQSGDAFLEALALAGEGDTDAALAALAELQETGFGAYPVLARMRSATLQAEAGDTEAAIAAFREIGQDGNVPASIRDVASLRAGYLLVDHGTYDDAYAVVNDLTGESDPMRHSAREILGLAAYRSQDIETAERWFTAIADDEAATQGTARRANIMLDLIAGYDPDGPSPAEPDAQAPQAGGIDTLDPNLMPLIPGPGEGAVPPGASAPEQTAPSGSSAAPELAPLEPLTSPEQ